MKRLLARGNVDTLADLAASRVLLAFDFDGTLAPIVADRDRAKMRAHTAGLLRRVCTLYPCAVISGRSGADVTQRLQGAKARYVVGNHGLETGSNLSELRREVGRARRLLEVALARCPGVDLEDKRYSLAVHYRRSPDKRAARASIHRAVAALPVRLRTVLGKLVVNLVPERAPNKGDALVQLCAAEGVTRALFVGDDVTDEDVFELDQPGRLVGVRIGASKRSAAEYFLRDQREVDVLLATLADLRAARAVR